MSPLVNAVSVITVRTETKLKMKLEELAAAHNLSLSEYVTEVLRAHVSSAHRQGHVKA